ncbi:MIP/aquaporin family protein [Spirosoma linguale]|uniref:Major intrinsic protein n=1 Tax=Spirosoma linguale (strain ATCC 33905 / DSM 74 / LMG 10896 / Claus 1) TaxID=504472 RepID=D2QGN3_SPILD|nr:major intrinsic protein [Spirosoma linguale DSM 74]
MLETLRKNWPVYLIEAWALGTFMGIASMVVIVVQHPSFPIREAVDNPLIRRAIIGVCMGLTAISLIYSPWGKRSGAHLNPAVTLAQWRLNRITTMDALCYILAQVAGGALVIGLLHILIPDVMAHPTVNHVATVPGPAGVWVALGLEFSMAFGMLTMVLALSNSKRLAPYTGYFVGVVVAIYITFEAPFSGMSINPARTLSSAISANIWTSIWIYFVGPISGMSLAGWLYRLRYRRRFGECRSMRMHLSGQRNGCQTYEVLWWAEEMNGHQIIEHTTTQ